MLAIGKSFLDQLADRNVMLALITLILCLITVRAGSQKPPTPKTIQVITRDFIFGDQRPFPQCHASSLLKTGDGQFIVTWFGGTHEKHNDVGIWLSRGQPGKWSVVREIAKVREVPHWNPVLFMRPDGKIILFFKVGSSIDEWQTWFITTDDDGLSWSVPRELSLDDKGGRGPVKNKMIVLSNGEWLAPASNEKKGQWNAFVDRSKDSGKTWRASPFIPYDKAIIPGEGMIQPSIWESSPGNVHMLLRSSSGWICRSDSPDYGRTWTPAYLTTLPNPNSGIDLTKMADGTLVLVYNPSGKNWGPRSPLSIAYSTDNGTTWNPHAIDLESARDGNEEFSYPAIISFGDTIAITYTWKRERIVFWMAEIK